MFERSQLSNLVHLTNISFILQYKFLLIIYSDSFVMNGVLIGQAWDTLHVNLFNSLCQKLDI